MNAFLTGSRVYGRPGPNSDIDLVVRVNEKTAALLRELADKQRRTPDGTGSTVRFGNLNLIVCETDEQYDVWVKGTAEIVKTKRKHDKVAAKAVFDKYRAEFGITDLHCSSPIPDKTEDEERGSGIRQ